MSNYPTDDDPQGVAVYRAQTRIARQHPEHDLVDLLSVQEYADEIVGLEGRSLVGCFRAWHYDGGVDLIIDRSMKDRDLAGQTIRHPRDQREVLIVPWHDRYSHFDQDYNEIVVGGPPSRPISHWLLIVHEVGHMTTPTAEMHGVEWAASFLTLTARYLPRLSEELRAAFDEHGVRYSTDA